MPVNKKMMDSMVKQYGAAKGRDVYYATENKMKGKVRKRSKLADSLAKHHA